MRRCRRFEACPRLVSWWCITPELVMSPGKAYNSTQLNCCVLTRRNQLVMSPAINYNLHNRTHPRMRPQISSGVSPRGFIIFRGNNRDSPMTQHNVMFSIGQCRIKMVKSLLFQSNNYLTVQWLRLVRGYYYLVLPERCKFTAVTHNFQ